MNADTSASDDEPTRPDGIAAPETLALVRVYGGLRPEARRHLSKLVEAWASCSLENRITVEAVARQLAKVPWEVV